MCDSQFFRLNWLLEIEPPLMYANGVNVTWINDSLLMLRQGGFNDVIQNICGPFLHKHSFVATFWCKYTVLGKSQQKMHGYHGRSMLLFRECIESFPSIFSTIPIRGFNMIYIWTWEINFYRQEFFLLPFPLTLLHVPSFLHLL